MKNILGIKFVLKVRIIPIVQDTVLKKINKNMQMTRPICLFEKTSHVALEHQRLPSPPPPRTPVSNLSDVLPLWPAASSSWPPSPSSAGTSPAFPSSLPLSSAALPSWAALKSSRQSRFRLKTTTINVQKKFKFNGPFSVACAMSPAAAAAAAAG